MASISNAKLAITVNSQAETAQCRVTCRVHFTPYERNQMKQGLIFGLNCKLWGDDWIKDDGLYNYSTKFFPDANPTSTENVSFTATVGTSLLNEDWGKDEIYGRLTLINFYTLNTVTKDTNVVQQKF